jgi:hypothetical protein
MSASLLTAMSAGQSIVGSWSSSTVITNEHVAVLPAASVAVHTTVVAPNSNV